MGDGIANEIEAMNAGGGADIVQYPSGFGASLFSGEMAGGGGGGGGMSEAEMLEAAIAASLQEMNIGSGEN